MPVKLLTLGVAASFLFFISTVRAAETDIVMNEIAAYEASGREWIEIYNAGVETVDLAGWKFWEGEANHNLSVVQGDFLLPGGAYAIIAQDGALFMTEHADVTARVFDSAWSTLSESGEEIGLKNAAGTIIEQFTFIEARDFSLERLDPLLDDYTAANWKEHASGHTAGKENDADGVAPPDEEPPIEPPAGATVPLLINEFVSDPADGEREWVELYNLSEEGVDLTGWTLEDATNSTIASPTSTISGHGFGVIFLSSVKLNNGGDTIRVKNPAGEIVDEIMYGTGNVPVPGKGQASARQADGLDTGNFATDFAVTHTPTPGTGNIITTSGIAPAETPSSASSPPVSANTTGGGSARAYLPREILINELVSDPSDGMDEFVELYNDTGESISLDGWHLEDGSETATVLSGMIASKQYFLIERPKGSLNNAGDLVALFDPSGKEIDQVTYGTWDDGNLSDNAPAAGDPRSLVRKAEGKDSDNDVYDFTLTTTISPGKVNVVSLPAGVYNDQNVTPIATGIILSEIFPNPPGPDTEEEFIEIKNQGQATIDVTGWKLGDASAKRYVITQGSIPPGDFLVFKRGQTGISLNNSGSEEVKLFTTTGVLVDQVTYSGSVKEATSFIRLDDTTWRWSASTTPGSENVFVGNTVAPVISLDVETEAAVGETVIFDASDTVTEGDGKVTFSWSFGDGGVAEGANAKHVFMNAGMFTVLVTAGQGGMVTSTKEVIMTIRPPGAFTGGPSGDEGLVVISEIVPNPTGVDDGEFIELFNPTELLIDLSGMKLDDEDGGSKPYTIPPNTLLLPGEYRAFTKKDTKLSLNNTSDEVRLLHTTGEVILVVAYDKTVEGASYALDQTGMFAWTSASTPGEVNTIQAVLATTKSTASRSTSKATKPVVDTTLGELRSFDVGDRVRVQGIVTALPGIFGTQYFYIGDDMQSGVQVYMSKKQFPNLQLGDRVEAVGEIGEISGETRLKITAAEDLRRLGDGEALEPRPIDTTTVDKRYEGALVQIVGEATEVKSTYLFLDDGQDEVKVYFKKGAGIDPKSVRMGETFSITGILGQTKTGYQLLPRSQNDLVKMAVATETVVADMTTTPPVIQTAESYLTTTAAGLTAMFLGFTARARAGVLKLVAKRSVALATEFMQKYRG